MGPGTVDGIADQEEDGIASLPSGRRLVVVPRQPGPLAPLQVGATQPQDDLDELVDEVFGPSTDERPGLFDALLLVGGGLVLAWAILSGAAVWIAAVAAVAVVLGLALPARSLVQRSRAAAASRRVRSAERQGYVLDVTSGSALALARAYDDAVAAAGLPGSVYSGRALDAAHLAVVEVATLLKGDPPDGPAQDEYVARRTAAIAALVGELLAANRRWLEKQAATEAEEEDRRRRWVDAVTAARDELQAEDRMGSLAQLQRITGRLSGEAADVGA